MRQAKTSRRPDVGASVVFFCWKLLEFVPDGTFFSQLNNSAVSATTKRDV